MTQKLQEEQKIQVLEKTLEVLGPEGERWGQGGYFMTEEGRVTVSISIPPPKGVKFCLAGAVCEAAFRLRVPGVEADDAAWADWLVNEVSLEELSRKKYGQPVIYFNDVYGRTFDEVRDLVIERLEQLRKENADADRQDNRSPVGMAGTELVVSNMDAH